MVRTLLVRGMLVGFGAGLFALVFAYVFGEPPLDSAIAYEEQLAHAAGEHGGTELVSRSVQSTIGLATGILAFGVAFGGIFGLAFAAVSGRLLRSGPRGSAALLALAGFVVVILVPFLKYPANPPAANEPGSIGSRTGLYTLMVLISVVVAIAAVTLGRRLALRFESWNAMLLAAGGYVLVIGLVMFGLPAVNETPADFPATVLYDFRVASLGIQIVLWTGIGLFFGALTDRSLRRGRAVPTAAGAAR